MWMLLALRLSADKHPCVIALARRLMARIVAPFPALSVEVLRTEPRGVRIGAARSSPRVVILTFHTRIVARPEAAQGSFPQVEVSKIGRNFFGGRRFYGSNEFRTTPSSFLRYEAKDTEIVPGPCKFSPMTPLRATGLQTEPLPPTPPTAIPSSLRSVSPWPRAACPVVHVRASPRRISTTR